MMDEGRARAAARRGRGGGTGDAVRDLVTAALDLDGSYLAVQGPPGTGKTLMARQIGKMLNAREPKVVNGPEILNKFVGQSEENIRKLFADAEKEVRGPPRVGRRCHLAV